MGCEIVSVKLLTIDTGISIGPILSLNAWVTPSYSDSGEENILF